MAAVQAGMEGAMIAIIIFFLSVSLVCCAENTNKVVKVEKEKKVEHQEGKIIVKERDKGSKKESDWKTSKEYPLMFKNNRKARPKK
jgi:hypothetical protein